MKGIVLAGGAGTPAIVTAFAGAAAVNYLLCILILFRHKARWGAFGELAAYVLTLIVMGLVDFGITKGLIACAWAPMAAKAVSSLCGFIGNFFSGATSSFSCPGRNNATEGLGLWKSV